MQILIEVSFREEGTKRSGNTKVGFVFSGMQVPERAFFYANKSEKIVLVVTGI